MSAISTSMLTAFRGLSFVLFVNFVVGYPGIWGLPGRAVAPLELIWLPDKTLVHPRGNPRLRVRSRDPSEASTQTVKPVEYEVSVCPTPRCGCESLLFSRPPGPDRTFPTAGELPRNAWFEPTTGSVVADFDEQGGPEFSRLESILREHLVGDDRQRLR